MQADYLIIGQGISGTWLSYYLLQAGKSVIVLDDGNALAAADAGGAGADVLSLAKEAAMGPVRRALSALDARPAPRPTPSAAALDGQGVRRLLGPVLAEDVAAALATVRPARGPPPEMYESWGHKHGSG